MLHVKRLDSKATLPTVAHPGEDMGYDVYALEPVWVYKWPCHVRTGIACSAYNPQPTFRESDCRRTGKLGLIIKDRSSMAKKGVFTHGGVIDAGYTGEIIVTLTHTGPAPYMVQAGDKIAQMVPVPVLTGPVMEVSDLEMSDRRDKGFGSSGT